MNSTDLTDHLILQLDQILQVPTSTTSRVKPGEPGEPYNPSKIAVGFSPLTW